MPPVLWFAVAVALVVVVVYRKLSEKTLPSPGADQSPAPSPGSPPPPSAPLAELTPKAGKPFTAQRIRNLSALIDKVWSDASGKSGSIPPAAREIALAQAAAEFTGFGQGWDGDMKDSGNVALASLLGGIADLDNIAALPLGAHAWAVIDVFGSYDALGGLAWIEGLAGYQGTEPTSYYRLVEHVDSKPMPDGSQKQYVTKFRFYIDGTTPDGKSRPAAEAGAWDFIHAITVKPFPAVEELLAGNVLWYAWMQHKNGYYEGFNLSPEGQAAWADSIAALVKRGVWLKKKGTRVLLSGDEAQQVAGRIALYASSMGRSLPEIAAALGQDKVNASVPKDLMTFKPTFVSSVKGAPVA